MLDTDDIQSLVRNVLTYDAATGALFWKERDESTLDARLVKSWNARYSGKRAGHTQARGYRSVIVCWKRFYSHQLVWIYHNGAIPKGMCIDHINHVRTDDRIENLRMVSYRENNRNVGLSKRSASGEMGVRKMWDRWAARIRIDGRDIHLGMFATKEEAAATRKAADKKYGFHKNHGLAA